MIAALVGAGLSRTRLPIIVGGLETRAPITSEGSHGMVDNWLEIDQYSVYARMHLMVMTSLRGRDEIRTGVP